MNIDIIRCVINNDYDNLIQLTCGKNDNLNKFYNLYADYYLNKSSNLALFLDETCFSQEEAVIIYDCLDQKSDLNDLKVKLLDKYKDYIDTKKAFKDEEVIGLVNKIKLPVTKDKKFNLNSYIGAIVFIAGIIGILIFSLLSWNLKDEIVYFCTILLLVIPCLLLVLGVNLVISKKINYLLIALETFLFIYILSFACLIPHFESANFFVNLKNHFYEVIKAIYSFFSYYTFKALEV